jgi:signal transduction histidine kinase
MRRFLPHTLFSQMVLILLGGLITAQLISTVIHLRERGKLLYRASTMLAAQRVADRVHMLDSLDPEAQRVFLGVLGSSDLRVSLDVQPGRKDTSRADNPAVDFENILRSQFANNRSISISINKTIPDEAPRHDMKWQNDSVIGQSFVPPELALIVQVQLQNGRWAGFEFTLPQIAFVWPYHLLANLLILLIAVLVLSLIAVRLVTRPLFILAEAAEDLGKNINRPPLAEHGSIEVRRAAQAFNTMQNRLVRYIQDRTRILAAMSHDLKTPITRLRLRVELLDDSELKAKFDKDLQEMESMVTATLDFMRGVDSQEPMQPVDIMALLESIQADGKEMGQEIHIQGALSHTYIGAPNALKRCLGNLIDNAIKYGMCADIALSDSEKRLEIRIRDHGPGIPETQLERVFEPFFRLEESRSRDTGGTGLGLSIARNIVQAHGGELVLRNLNNGGLEALLVLPRSN